MSIILGISAYYHDSAAVLLKDGVIVAAAQEERFTRIKADSSFPHNAINFCLDYIKLDINDIDHVVFYENHLEKFDRLLESYKQTFPWSLKSFLYSMPKWLLHNLWMEREICNELGIKKHINFCDHHLSHACSAFFPSPYKEAAIITLDGVGEWSTTTIGVGKENNVELLEELRFPNSLGLLYSAFTHFIGFKINDGEYKLMGLAPYGKPIYKKIILEKIIHINENGSFILNQKYFNYIHGLTMTNKAFENLFGGPRRQPESEITQREMDIAASIQAVTEDIIISIARYVRKKTGMNNLTLAGGVALNVVAFGKLAQTKIYDSLWIQPAAGDAGSALGAALWYTYMIQKQNRIVNIDDDMQGCFLGPDITSNNFEDSMILKKLGAVWEDFDDEELTQKIADLLATQHIIGVARGRMEWGPRALGARSILGDARNPRMQSYMNLKIKFRESFRPFAPMVLIDYMNDWFDITQESPYMLLASPVNKSKTIHVKNNKLQGIDLLNVCRSQIPAVTHVDYSSRVQTIDIKRNPFIYNILSKFMHKTKCPVIINTSFNVRGEPIVCTCEDAYRCFMMTDIDVLILGNRLLLKKQQNNYPNILS